MRASEITRGSYEGLKLLGVSSPNSQGKIFTWPQLLVERQRFLDGGGGALPKVLEAYMGEVVWPHPPEVNRQGLHGHWPNVEA
jgi:hypothetical protein